ncbi:MAG: C40 family peptidase [Tannerella sp.]|jgi:hypothetical protein|nr:C40 family peptidase [Tannerella sp.]
MKKLFLFLPLTLLLPLAAALWCGCTQTYSNAIQQIADDVREQFVPDGRVDVFDITVSRDNGKTVLKGVTTLAGAKDELIRRALVEDKNTIDSVVVLPEKRLGDHIFGVVTLSVASMRDSGDYSAEMATQALLGTPVKILQGGSWLRVQTPEGYISYTYSGNIKRMDKQQFNEWITAPKIIFTESYGFSYRTPDASEVVSDLVAGNVLKLEEEAGKYFKVSYPDGRIAFVKKDETRKFEDWYAAINLTGEDIVACGKRLMGVPYLWGGTSSKSMDCSGFSKTVYLMHGIILPRDASQQCLAGQPVDVSENYDNLQVGDLLFFGKKAENGSKERIWHVAIYAGNHRFIHEATQVKINSFDATSPDYDEYNTKRLVRASRIIGSVDTEGITTLKSNAFYQPQE